MNAGAASTSFLKIDITAQYKHHNTDDKNRSGGESLSGLFVGQLEEDSSGENDADTGAHGGADKAQDQLDVGDEDAHSEADEDEADRDQVEPGRGNVVCNQLSGANTLVGLPEQEAVDTGPAGEHHQREWEGNGDAETHLQHLDEIGVLEVGQDVPSHVSCVEGDVAEESDSDIDSGAHIDGALSDLGHLTRGGVREAGVNLEYVCLTRQGHREDGETLQHSTWPPKVDLRHPLPRLKLWRGLENDSEDDEHIEPDAGGADVLETGDVPDEGKGERHKETECGEDHQPQVRRVLQLGNVGNDRRPKVAHHHKEGNSGANQVADDAELDQKLTRCAESLKCQVLKISPPCQ